jgi:2-oxoglutarate ferredoxin oxidoreductase subunit alpha
LTVRRCILDYTIKIGGEAGQGIQTIGDTLSKVFSRSGYYVFSHQDYESRVRGGHNFYQIRLSDKPVSSSRTKVDILVALDKASIEYHEKEMSDDGIIVYDSTTLGEKFEKSCFLDIPFIMLAVESGGDKVMSNTAATGAVLGMLGLSLDPLHDILKNEFKNKGEDVLKINEKTAAAGRDFAQTHCLSCSFAASALLPAKMLIGVHDAVGLGAIASGCKFYAAYPMTPSTGIMLYMAANALEYGIIVEQAEDEISAVNMAIGASYAGVRSMTGSSGGGFALMVEGLSLASITETPIVIALAQRPGPATGLPTRTEQADLLFALHAGHGEFPRLIFAPGTPEQALFLTNKAFELSQKYQVPALILTDQYLSDAQWTVDELSPDNLVYNDYRLRGDKFYKLTEYKRHAYAENGVSPFGVPGESHHVVVTDSDEHDEEGHLIEDAETRIKMMQKRVFKKLPLITGEICQPLHYGHENPEIVFVCWGSLYGVVKESVDQLLKDRDVAMLHFSEIYPVPQGNYLNVLKNAKKTICIEQNATGQFAQLIKVETGFEFDSKINRYDGRPFLLEEMIGEINALI